MAPMTLSLQDKNRLGIAKLSLILGALLLILKFVAYEITDSEAILSDALESVVNVLGALIAVITIGIAAKPADEDHPYGHGKAEYFSVAFEGGFISFAAILIIYHASHSLIKGNPMQEIEKGLWITIFAGAVNGALGLYLKKSGKKLKSQALKSGGEHLITDFVTSVAVVAGLTLVYFTGLVWIDSVVAILFGLYLLRTGFKLFKRSLSDLMDAEDQDVIVEVGKLFSQHIFPGIIRIHRTRVMRAGRFHHIDAHLVVPEFWEIRKAHAETEKFENKIIKDYEHDGEIRFHLDPCRQAYCEVCDLADCPIRQKPFQQRLEFSLKELTDPEEPEEFR